MQFLVLPVLQMVLLILQLSSLAPRRHVWAASACNTAATTLSLPRLEDVKTKLSCEASFKLEDFQLCSSLCSSLLSSTLLSSTLLYSALLCPTLLCSTLLYSTLFYSTLRYLTQLSSTFV